MGNRVLTKYLIAICFCLFARQLNAQDCGCIDNFNHMVSKVEKNYAGYADKVTQVNHSLFVHYTDSLGRIAARTDERNCVTVLRSWIKFFNDRHMTLAIKGDNPGDSIRIRALFANAETQPISRDQLMRYLDGQKDKLDSLEGIWQNEDDAYQIAFIRDRQKKGQEFVGIILRADSVFWLPGQVKARVSKHGRTYRMRYFYNKYHDTITPILALARHTLNAGVAGIWRKVYPGDNGGEVSRGHYYDPLFRTLDNQTCLLVMPSFSLLAKPLIDSLIEQNRTVISQIKHLIVDLRNNTGGSVLCFQKLLPYLYTNPIITKGQSVMATDDNIKDLYSITDYPNISDSMETIFKNELKELQANRGGMYKLWKDDTLTMPTVLPYPKTISFIVNESSASAAEILLLKAKQSTKVTLYGRHSMGAIDYLDVASTPMPCQLYTLRYATSRTNRLPEEPLDNKGIEPDVEIPDNVVDWVEFVRTK